MAQGTAAAPAPKANMGQPVERIDGHLKVTGGAKYPSDLEMPNQAWAALVMSDIAKGRITGFDLDAAKAMPGVIRIFTYEDIKGRLKQPKMMNDAEDPGYASSTIQPMDGPEILHAGQIVAIVTAESFETAMEAARSVEVSYDDKAPSATFGSDGVREQAAKDAQKSHEDPSVGDADKALAAAEIKIDARYSTPTQHHNPIELFTTSVLWDGDRLVVHEPSQTPIGLRFGLARQLNIDPDKVLVTSKFIGGAFGSKGALTERTPLLALVAKEIGRPVKFVSTRAQAYHVSTYRAETEHRVALAAFKDGRLSAVIHEGYEVTSRPDSYFVGGTDATSRMYACPNVRTKVTVVHADRKTPGFMRAPAEVPYMYALECAMDELAERLGMDPIELRRVNDTMKEPIKGLPYTSRSLMACFDEGARVFGWSRRRAEPGAVRDGDWLVGLGCATSCYPTMMAPATARVTLKRTGEVRVETGAQDIGTGTYTVVAQVAAERLGVALDKVKVVLGDSSLPPAPVSGGSNVTASVCNVVAKACDDLRAKLDPQNLPLEQALDKLGHDEVEGYAETVSPGQDPKAIDKMKQGHSALTGGAKLKDRIQFSFGAQFVEVGVHARTKEIRVRRFTGVFASGHIMNPRTARSQLMGGMIGGLGSALLEETEIDRKLARYVNKNLSEYEIAVNADVPEMEVILLSEMDDKVNDLGIKGLGELGIVGTAAAIANAVYNATGKRVRDLPIRAESLIG